MASTVTSYKTRVVISTTKRRRISFNADGFSGIASKLTKIIKFIVRDLGLFSVFSRELRVS